MRGQVLHQEHFVYEGKEFHFMGINALTLDRRVDRKSTEDLRKVKTKY